MAAELLRGRERRYFGYLRNTTHKVDTPESAKSFRSIMSIPPRQKRRQYEPTKTFKPDPPGQNRFADKIIHRAVKTQIPGLLPALKNSPQFDAYGENAILLRSPTFEQHQSRSLYNFWLPPEDRQELCGLLKSHLKPDKRRRRITPAFKLKAADHLSGLAAESAALEQQEYLESIAKDPKLFPKALNRGPKHGRISVVPSRIYRMNRKFQTAYWNPTVNKHLSDPFGRKRGKLPAAEAICNRFFEDNSPENQDILTCAKEYKARYDDTPDLSLEHIALEEKKEHLRRRSLYGTLEDEAERRGIKHIKQIKEYDKQSNILWKKQARLMISAAEYLNKIRKGRRFPTPPKCINKRGGARKNRESSSDSESIDVDEYLNQLADRQRRRRTSTAIESQDKIAAERREQEDKAKWRKHQHYHHTYGDDFYMEMYLHFLNPEEDVSLKAPTKQLTDVKELRKKMNLDEDPEKDKKLLDLIKDTSMESLQVREKDLSRQDRQKEKEILRGFIQRLNNPRLTHALTKVLSQASFVPKSTESEELHDGGEGDFDEEDDEEEEELALEAEDAVVRSEAVVRPTSPDSDEEDDELDVLGDIPENELKIIMNEIGGENEKQESSSDESSESSHNDENVDADGEVKDDDDDEAAKLFKKAKKKKDSLADLMDLTPEYRARICQGLDPTNKDNLGLDELNPFQEAVCILYPDGGEKLKKKKAVEGNTMGRKSVDATDKRSSTVQEKSIINPDLN